MSLPGVNIRNKDGFVQIDYLIGGLTSTRREDLTPAVRLARALHTTPPATPAEIRAHLHDAPHVLPALARCARAGDRHALLLAAVLMRRRLRAIATHAGPDGYLPCGAEERQETLTLFCHRQPGVTPPPRARQRPGWGRSA